MERYDGTLQMIIETPKPVNMDHLAFLRWLGEQGRLEHRIAGPSSGALVPVQPSPSYSSRAA